jgi:glycerophosphoryl diester phosphodiesterase
VCDDASVWRRGEQQPGPGLVIAHRAGAALTDGDPVRGVRALVGGAAAMIEFDVRRTADGVLVVHHDPVAGGMALAGYRYADFQNAIHPPPPLRDLMAAAGSDLAFDVELKEAGYEQTVLETVLEFVSPERVVFTSFDDRVVAAVARGSAAVGVGLIVGARPRLRNPLAVLRDLFPFRRLEQCGGDFLVAHRRLLASGLTRRAMRRGVGLVVWGVDDPVAVDRLRHSPDVLGVITDSAFALLGVSSTRGVGETQAREEAGGL